MRTIKKYVVHYLLHHRYNEVVARLPEPGGEGVYYLTSCSRCGARGRYYCPNVEQNLNLPDAPRY